MIDRLVPANIRHNFRIDLSSSLLMGVFLASVVNFLPVVARRLGANELQLAVIVAVPLAGNLLTPIAVYIPARLRFRSMLTMWAVARSLFIFTLFITRPTPFVFIVVLYYVLATIPAPVYVEIMGSIYPSNVRGRAMSYVRTGMTAVMTVVTPLAGILMDRLGFPIVFTLGALAALVSVAVYSQLRDASFSTRRTNFRSVVAILGRDHMFAVYSLALMFLGTGLLVGAPLYPIVQVDQLHLSYGDVGVLSLLSSLAWMLSSAIMGWILDRKGALLVMLIANVTQAAISLCYFMATDVKMVALAFVFSGLSAAAGDLAWLNCVLLFAGPGQVPDYSALHMLLVGARGIIGPLLGAILISVVGLALRQTLFVSFGVQVVGCLIMVWVLLTYRSGGRRVSKGV